MSSASPVVGMKAEIASMGADDSCGSSVSTESGSARRSSSIGAASSAARSCTSSSQQGMSARASQPNAEAQRAAKLAAMEAIEDSSFSNEHLEILLEREQRMLSALVTSDKAVKTPLTSEVRSRAVNFLNYLVDHMELPSGTLAQACGNLDVVCHHALGMEDIADLPGICVAICRILHKQDKASTVPDLREDRNASNWFLQQLRDAGYVQQETAQTPFHVLERKVLQVLSWQIVPTVDNWLVAECGRFDTATRGLLRPSLKWMWQRSVGMSKVVLQQRSTYELPPQRFARGLLCTGFIAAGIIQLYTSQPLALRNEEWSELIKSTQNGACPKCILDTQGQHRTLQFLMLATRSTLEEMQEDALELSKIVREAMSAKQSKQVI